MYIIDDIAHAGEPTPALRISGVRPLSDYRLWVRFNTGEAKIFDFTPLLQSPAFAPLKDQDTFSEVYIDYGVATWDNGNIDIASDYLYNHGAPTGDTPATEIA